LRVISYELKEVKILKITTFNFKLL